MPLTIKMADLNPILTMCFILLAVQASTTQGILCPSACRCDQDFRNIDCSNARLTRVPDFSAFRKTNIATLDLSRNNGLLLNEGGIFSDLEINILKLSNCEIQTIKEGVFQDASVDTLYLDGNPITFLPDEISFKGLESSLQYLILQNTQLEKFPTKQLDTLKLLVDLDISHNAISTIIKSDFKSIRAKRIYLNNNYLNSIHRDAFNKIPYVEHLDVSNNQIVDPSFLWHICKFREVNLSSNPLDCDCDFVKYRKFETGETFSGICNTPTAMQGLKIGSKEFIKTGSKVCSVGGVPAVQCYSNNVSHEIYKENLSFHLHTKANNSNVIKFSVVLLLLTVLLQLL